MQNSMYSGLFGALTCENRLNITANNLANVNTNGYKRDQLAFKDVFGRYAHDIIMEPVANIRSEKLLPEPMHISKTRIAESRIDFTQGSLRQSDGPFDLALTGEGFFKIQTANGAAYTRNGHFNLTSDGQLVNMQGQPVLGGGGPITIPPGSKAFIDSTGRIFADKNLVAQLDVVTVDDPKALEKVGNNLFRIKAKSAAAEVAATNAQVNQGYLEAANIEVVEEMVNMIETQRAFEAYQKVMSSADEIDKKSVSSMGRTSF